MARRNAARALSVLGHPAVLMPVAVVGSAVAQGAPRGLLLAAAGATLFIAVCVGLYSIVQVRAGHWRHVDASVPHERRQLHGVLVLLMFGTAAVLWGMGLPLFMAMALMIGGGIVVFAYGVSPWLKVSLHVAFAVLAACLLWPLTWAAAACLVLAAGVAWSRLALHRHTSAEVALGWVAGAVAGGGFHLFVR